MTIQNARKGLSGNQLKLVAAVSMLVDHVGYLFIGMGILVPLLERGEINWNVQWAYRLMRMAGRMAFPIFCFLLVEGFFHTGSRKRYALRLGLFAALSEIPFDLLGSGLLIDPRTQNVMVTLLLGFLMMGILEHIKTWDGPASLRTERARLASREAALFVQLGVIMLFCMAAWLLKSDYDYEGIMLIALFYWLSWDRKRACILGFFWMAVMTEQLYFLPGLAAAFFLIFLYNGKRGSWNGKYMFYLFYPVHMAALAGIYRLLGM